MLGRESTENDNTVTRNHEPVSKSDGFDTEPLHGGRPAGLGRLGGQNRELFKAKRGPKRTGLNLGGQVIPVSAWELFGELFLLGCNWPNPAGNGRMPLRIVK